MISARVPSFPFLLGAVAAGGLFVCGVLLAQWLNLAACPLCIWQRMMYLLYGVCAGIGLAGARQALVARLAALAMAAAAAAGAGIAGYQVWIQRFAPLTTCAGKEPWWEAFVRWAGEQAPLLFKASGLCSDPAWQFLGLSIADWSLLCFAGLFALALYALRGRRNQ